MPDEFAAQVAVSQWQAPFRAEVRDLEDSVLWWRAVSMALALAVIAHMGGLW